MLRVYKVRFESGSFQRFYPVDEGLYQSGGQLDIDGRPKRATWKPLDVYVLHPLRDIPCVWQLSSGSGQFIVRPDVVDKLAYPLRTAGELLPVNHEGREFLLLNVTEVINCLDREKTEFRRFTSDGIGLHPVKYAFHARRFTAPVFKIPEQVKSSIFAVEWSGNPARELKAAVEHHGLRGIKFELVWELDEKGAGSRATS